MEKKIPAASGDPSIHYYNRLIVAKLAHDITLHAGGRLKRIFYTRTGMTRSVSLYLLRAPSGGFSPSRAKPEGLVLTPGGRMEESSPLGRMAGTAEGQTTTGELG